jgi:ABC-2 type transport system permease protein
MFLGGIAYPLAKLPDPIEAVARLLPAAALSECLRAVLQAGPFPGGALAVLLVWAVAAPLAAARWFRWEEG